MGSGPSELWKAPGKEKEPKTTISEHNTATLLIGGLIKQKRPENPPGRVHTNACQAPPRSLLAAKTQRSAVGNEKPGESTHFWNPEALACSRAAQETVWSLSCWGAAPAARREGFFSGEGVTPPPWPPILPLPEPGLPREGRRSAPRGRSGRGGGFVTPRFKRLWRAQGGESEKQGLCVALAGAFRGGCPAQGQVTHGWDSGDVPEGSGAAWGQCGGEGGGISLWRGETVAAPS